MNKELKTKGIRGTELLDYPLGTKFRLSHWDKATYMYLERGSRGLVRIFELDSEVEKLDPVIFIQDSFELYDESVKEAVKEARSYLDRYEALRLVYEEGAKVAYDDEEWGAHYSYLYLTILVTKEAKYSEVLNVKTGDLYRSLSSKYSENKWFRVKE